MNRKLLPTLIALVSFGTAGAAYAADNTPTVYGRINVTLNKYDLQNVDDDGEAADNLDNWELESNSSRLGVKGDLEISSNLKAIYKLEYQIYVDDSQSEKNAGSDEFGSRNIYGGLQGGWGTILAGKHDTPLKLAQTAADGTEIDRFNDLPLGDIQNFMVGENRESNIIMYSTPDFSGFGATLAIMPGEEDGIDSDTDDSDENDGPADNASLALTYNTKMFYVGLAADQNVQNTDTVRLAGNVNLGDFKIGALYQTAETNDDDADDGEINPIASITSFGDLGDEYNEQDAWLLSGEWKFAADWVLKAQYGASESTPVEDDLDDTELTQIALGVDYKLSKASRVFAYYASVEGEGDDFITDDTVEDKTFAVGYELKF